MYLIKKIEFDSLENHTRNARVETIVGVIDGDENDASKWIDEHSPESNKLYRGWDGKFYPYYEKTPIDVIYNNQKSVDAKKALKSEDVHFTWTDTEDDELYKNGITIIWVVGRQKAIQKFVEALSYKIGYKCDFAFTAGRAHIDVSQEGYAKASDVLNQGFVNQFIVPYSKETYENETYFELI